MRAFLFDIGGVLLDFDLAHLVRLAEAGGLKSPDVLLRLREDDSLRRIESGLISGPEYFARHVEPEVPRWRYRDLIEAWKVIFSENSEGLALVREARARGGAVYFLSNMADFNRIAIEERFPGFFGLSDRPFLSCDMGCVKPEPAIYHRVLQAIGLPAACCFFMDDTPGHVAAARQLGMAGCVYRPGAGAAIRAAWSAWMDRDTEQPGARGAPQEVIDGSGNSLQDAARTGS